MLNQKGFSHIEMILLIAVIAIVSLVGFNISQNNHKTSLAVSSSSITKKSIK